MSYVVGDDVTTFNANHFPYRHEVKWNDKSIYNMSQFSSIKPDIQKCSGLAYFDYTYK